jgi:hypothetical protein
MGREGEAPPTPDPAQPEEAQTSIHAQTVGPKPATSGAPDEPAERTLEEESLRRVQRSEETAAIEPRRDEP